jgi:hypothetical protein
MAVAFIQEFAIVNDDHSTTNYDAIAERLGTDPPDGAIVHTAGFDDEAGVFRIFDVWESKEQAERFVNERVMPLVAELAPDAAQPTRHGYYELHDLVKA